MKPESVLAVFCSVVVLVFAAVVFPGAQVNAEEFKDTFIKKCKDYRGQDTCERIWTAFEQAYVGKDDSEVTAKSYDKLFDMTSFKHPCGGTMLWSGPKDSVERFTKDSGSFYAFRDTLLGHVLEGETWCGKRGSKETFTKCDKEFPKAVESFWEMASTRFAQHACDEVTVMLDGERPQPFSDKSFFGKFEVPNLQQGKVKQLTIVPITDSNRHQCNKESIKNLENRVKTKKIASACKEVTKLLLLDCIKRKNYKSCW